MRERERERERERARARERERARARERERERRGEKIRGVRGRGTAGRWEMKWVVIRWRRKRRKVY